MVEYILPDLTAIPSYHELPNYTYTSNLYSINSKGVSNLYSVILWEGRVYLQFELDMEVTGVENTVESITSYLSNNPMIFYYAV